jgi:acetyltransferase-like isoleucine patch superfamily enzyme
MTKKRPLLFRLLKKSASRLVILLDTLIDRCREPTIIGREYVTGLNKLSGIYPSTIISVRRSRSEVGHVRFGKGVYLGRRVEIEAGEIEIDDDTSLQDGCAIRGHVRIGAHCIFGHNGLVISTSHRFRDEPEWLIRDQDATFHGRIDNHPSITVQIDDDCWFGWGCAVMPGVHIGRGAVVGANSVVTKNIGPYEVHGGAPNRKIGHRLVFVPPPSLCAMTDAHLPYFYRGFRLLQEDLMQSRLNGVILGRSYATVVLAGIPMVGLVLKGHLFGNRDMNLRFSLNGQDLGSRNISPGDFEITLACADKVTEHFRKPFLALHTLLEWQAEGNAGQRSNDGHSLRYGISTVELLKAENDAQSN